MDIQLYKYFNNPYFTQKYQEKNYTNYNGLCVEYREI